MKIIEQSFTLGGLVLLTSVIFTLTFICLIFLANKKEKRAKYFALTLIGMLLTGCSLISLASEFSSHVGMILDGPSLALFLIDYPMLIVTGSLAISIIIAGRALAIKWVRTGSMNRAFATFGRRLALEIRGEDIGDFFGSEKR